MEFFNETFWVGLSFVIFVALAAKPVAKALTKILDARAAKVQNDLDEALRLKEEAQALLSSYQKKHKEISDEAERIIEFAKSEAKRILEDSEAELEENINKRIELSMQKISGHEAAIVKSVKEEALSQVIEATKKLVAANCNEKTQGKLVKEALNSVSDKLIK